MGFKKNVVKVDLCSYPPYMFLAPKKFGKTTFWYNLVREAWGSDDKGLLISFGSEEGYHSLDGIQVEVAKEWDADYDEETDLRGFVQIVDDLVDNNSEYGIKGVCFDTLDTMVDVCTKEVLQQHRKEKGTPCKSLLDALGGYSRGKQRLMSLMDEQIARLRDAGFCVFFLAHTKLKEKTDMMSGEKYEQITNNLTDDIYSHFADAAQMVMVGAIDREINGGKILSESRVVYLRGNSFVDAGGRFTSIPEKIELSPKAFLDAFEQGVKGSLSSNVDDKTIAKMKKAEESKAEKNIEIAKEKDQRSRENKVDEERNAELLTQIKAAWANVSSELKDKVKTVMAKYNVEKLSDASAPTAMFEEIVQIIS